MAILGIAGIRWFNNMWFKDRPNHFSYTMESNPIHFDWATAAFGNYIEPQAAITIPVGIAGLPNKFYFQFDTGAPNTLLYQHVLHSMSSHGKALGEINLDDKLYLESIELSLAGNPIKMNNIEILQAYGDSFNLIDTIHPINLGTLGADFMVNTITAIDFKNQYIQQFDQRPKSMDTVINFQSFDFKGRRFMLPAKIGGKKIELFYDSGSSAFGLITSKNRYDKYTDKEVKELQFDANRFGDPMPIHHKYTDRRIDIGSADLELKRISYVNRYAKLQRFLTPFTKIGGWLGNKPFTESTLILDTKKEEFVVIEDLENP